MAYREDTIAYPQLVALAACLATEMTASELPEVCMLGVLPGALVAYDSCGACGSGVCGQAWVRLVSAFPSTTLPEPIARATTASTIAFQLEVGIMRCAPGPDDRGNAPTAEEFLESVRLQLADMAAMRRAIACCLADADTDYILGSYSPSGPDGGCVGGTWALTMMQEF